nr:RNA-directed DNA polymerase [uncultured Carboxylicivirga sp.]
MKRYSEYADEITPEELRKGLIGYGIFAEKIPQFLSSESFYEYYNQLESFPSDKPKDYIRYWNMRSINIPRPLAIPEPFAYAKQVTELSNNWENLKEYFRERTQDNDFKISRIHIRKLINTPSLFEMNYKNFSKDGEPENDIVIRSRFIVKADISNCFGSIYSHSISWALIGKKEAKTKTSPSHKNEWFNKLDIYTRNIKNGETNGILIGPHASNLISEVILVSIDKKLSQKGYLFVRNIDDYSCYVDSYEKAERFLIDLSEELKVFELTLNTKKSDIKSLPQANVKNWVTKLNHFIFPYTQDTSTSSKLRLKVLKGFLDYAIELMLDQDSDSAILNYAIKTFASKELDRNAFSYYIKQIHHLVLLYPYLIVYLDEFVFTAHSVDKHQIKSIAIDIYILGMKKKNYEMCSYAIYWAIKYNFDLGISSLKSDALESMDCVFMLVAYLFHKKRRMNAEYLVPYFEKARELQGLEFDRYWVFIYELLGEDELSDFYKNMKRNKITFIKPNL